MTSSTSLRMTNTLLLPFCCCSSGAGLFAAGVLLAFVFGAGAGLAVVEIVPGAVACGTCPVGAGVGAGVCPVAAGGGAAPASGSGINGCVASGGMAGLAACPKAAAVKKVIARTANQQQSWMDTALFRRGIVTGFGI